MSMRYEMPPMFSWEVATTSDAGVSTSLKDAESALEDTLRATGAPMGVVERAFHKTDGSFEYDRIMSRAIHDCASGEVVWKAGDA